MAWIGGKVDPMPKGRNHLNEMRKNEQDRNNRNRGHV